MKENLEQRSEMLALYLIENHATVRAAAKKFGISKSTVHKDISERLLIDLTTVRCGFAVRISLLSRDA